MPTVTKKSTTPLGEFEVQAGIVLDVRACGDCGVVWGMTRQYVADRRKDGKSWVCPNGHPWVYGGPTEEQKLREEIERARENLARKERALDGALRTLNETAQERDHERARANGYKGVVAKTKKRLANGVCPYCNRSGFAQLGRHVTSKHPGETVPV